MKNLLLLAEQERGYGYSVLAAEQEHEIHRVPSQLKGARLLCFGNVHCMNRDLF